MALMIKPELIVVGAGPGDPELITIKAQKALMEADVVLYDNLANKELLNLTKPDCENLYVGKLPYWSVYASGNHSCADQGKGT
jgi:uroporphyrin-III C-methyltransferase